MEVITNILKKNWYYSCRSLAISTRDDLLQVLPGSVVSVIRKKISELGFHEDDKEVISISSNKKKEKWWIYPIQILILIQKQIL